MSLEAPGRAPQLGEGKRKLVSPTLASLLPVGTLSIWW